MQQDRLLAAGTPDDYGIHRGWAGRPEYGNSLLVRAPLEADGVERLDLGHRRSALRVVVTLPGGGSLLVAVTHLHHRVPDAAVRDEQARALVAWLDAAAVSDAQVVMGDFNADPDEPAYGRMVGAGFRSAYAEANGGEPAVTWPSGLQAPAMDTDGDPSCLDYIWIRGAGPGDRRPALGGSSGRARRDPLPVGPPRGGGHPGRGVGERPVRLIRQPRRRSGGSSQRSSPAPGSSGRSTSIRASVPLRIGIGAPTSSETSSEKSGSWPTRTGRRGGAGVVEDRARASRGQRLAEARIDADACAQEVGDDLGRLAGADEGRGEDGVRGEAGRREEPAEPLRLAPALLGQRPQVVVALPRRLSPACAWRRSSSSVTAPASGAAHVPGSAPRRVGRACEGRPPGTASGGR